MEAGAPLTVILPPGVPGSPGSPYSPSTAKLVHSEPFFQACHLPPSFFLAHMY
jgi:hypothetical protein